MIFTFDRPVYLFLLFIIPIMVFMHFFLIRIKNRRALKFANFEAISRVEGVDILSKNMLILFLSIIIVILLVFSLAGMNIVMTIPSSSFSFTIAIDSSRSMEAKDFSPNRLEAAKSAAIEFVDATPVGTKIAVVSFAGNAFIEQSLISDKIILKQVIKEIPLSSIGGTDLAEAVITSTNLLKGEKAKSVILISDGRINVGTVDDAIEYAKENEVIVHTIAIGTSEGGETSYGLSKADENSLKALAYNTGGKFFSAKDAGDLTQAYFSILDLKNAKVKIDISNYLVMAALILITLEFILYNSKYRILP